jgi:flagellar motor switch protein FliN/FliY
MTDEDKPDQTTGSEDATDQESGAEATKPDESATAAQNGELNGNGEFNGSGEQNGDDELAGERDGDQNGAGEVDDDLDLWAAAMAEQEAQEAKDASAENGNGGNEEADLWAAAMAEQEAQTPSEPAPSSAAASPANQQAETPAQPHAEAAGEQVFRPLEQSGQASESRDLEMILDIPVKLSVELGRTKVTIKQLLEMAQGSVVELDGLAGEPMDILINGYLIAQGEVVVVEDKYGIRITEIISPSERVQKLNR